MSQMKGKICLITGSNSGIGKETAIGLAKLGATVVMVVRSQERGEKAKADVIEKTGNKSVDLLLCDLSLMSSIKDFARKFKAKYDRLNVLINNAGAVFDKREVTSEGFERTLAVDYLGPFLLTHELLDMLKAGHPSRIINVSSGLHKGGSVNLADLQSEKNYKGMKVYSNTKLMLTMFNYELARRLEGSGITANSLMPGFVATNLGRSNGSLRSSLLFTLVRPMQISAKKGAETSIYLASSPNVECVSGKMFKEKKEVNSSPISYNEILRKELWEKTETLLSKWL